MCDVRIKYIGKFWIPKRNTVLCEVHDGMFDYDNEIWTWHAPVYFGFAKLNKIPDKIESYASYLITKMSQKLRNEIA